MSNKTMGILYGIAALCFAVSGITYLVSGNILKGIVWVGLAVACGCLGYLRIRPSKGGPADGHSDSEGGDGSAASQGPDTGNGGENE